LSILTKICVVVLVVLVLLACPIFITQATVAPNYRDRYEKERLRANNYAQQFQAERLRAERLLKKLEELTKKVEDLQDRIARLQNAKDQSDREYQRKIAELKGAAKLDQANLSRLATVVQKDQVQIAALGNDLKAARAKIDELNRESLDLKNELDEALARADRMQLQARRLREENARLVRENKNLRSQLALGEIRQPGMEIRPVVQQPEITGRITAIYQDVAQINIGSAQGIQRNMKLMVYRGGDFVAHLIIDDVEVGEAAGIIVNKRLEPMQGDMVVTLPTAK